MVVLKREKEAIMKTFLLFPVILITILVSNFFGQEVKKYQVKYFKESSKDFTGLCKIECSYIQIKDEYTYKSFEINVTKSGEYYLTCWSMGFYDKNSIVEYDIYMDGKMIGKVKPNNTFWQENSVIVNGKEIQYYFSQGTHKIDFKCKIPFIAAVEFISLSKERNSPYIDDDVYKKYIKGIKEDEENIKYTQSDDTLKAGLKKVYSNPNGNYVHYLNRPFAYSYYAFFYFKNGYHVKFETKRLDPYGSDPVMHLFNDDDPLTKGSWTDNNSGEGLQSKIEVNINYDGVYGLYIRSYPVWKTGTSDLYYNDNLYASDIPFNNYGWRCEHNLTIELNYFTSFATNNGDTRIWIEDNTNTPGLIVAENDDYNGSGDFNWGRWSRVKKAFNRPIGAMHVSAWSSYSSRENCDYYMNCRNSDIMTYFPNLKADDAIQSAPESPNYNCISWSGGIVDRWCWPPDPFSPWYDPNPLIAFDNYYGNSPGRYNGAWNYTRTGAFEDNSTVALWANNGEYTHASVNANHWIHSTNDPANDHPHGYDWESKPGSLMRTFHPKNALSGSSYGNIVKYYKWDGTYYYANSLAKVNKTEGNEEILSKNDIKKLSYFIEKIPVGIKDKFNKKYSAWKATWKKPQIAIYSNPRKYAESEEYNELLKYCKKMGKGIWPLFIKNFIDGDLFVVNLYKDLTFKEYEKYLVEIRNESKKLHNATNGSVIAPSLRANAFKYTKKLIELADETWELYDNQSKGFGTGNESSSKKLTLIQNYPNPFNPETQIKFRLPQSMKVTIKVYDLMGKEIATLINDKIYTEGWHTIIWNGKDDSGNRVASGIYICQIKAGMEIKTLKLNLIK